MTEIKCLTALQIPVEIFIIFLIQNKNNFTVIDVINMMENKHKVRLTFNRMNQILNDFVMAEKISKELKPNGKKGKPTYYYTFKKID